MLSPCPTSQLTTLSPFAVCSHRYDVRVVQNERDQNANTTLACIEESLTCLKGVCPAVESVYMFSDGAANYVSSTLAVNLHGVGQRTGIRILEHAKCEAGGGKGVCDECIAHIKFRLKCHVVSAKTQGANDVVNPRTWFEKIEENNTEGGIVSYISIKPELLAKQPVHKVMPLTEILPATTGVERVYVVSVAEDGGLRCAEAFDCGPGVECSKEQIAGLYTAKRDSGYERCSAAEGGLHTTPYSVMQRPKEAGACRSDLKHVKPRISRGAISVSDDLRQEMIARREKTSKKRAVEEEANELAAKHQEIRPLHYCTNANCAHSAVGHGFRMQTRMAKHVGTGDSEHTNCVTVERAAAPRCAAVEEMEQKHERREAQARAERPPAAEREPCTRNVLREVQRECKRRFPEGWARKRKTRQTRLTDEQKAVAWRLFDVRPKLSAEAGVVIFNDEFRDPYLHLDASQMSTQFKWMLKAREKNPRVGLAADLQPRNENEEEDAGEGAGNVAAAPTPPAGEPPPIAQGRQQGGVAAAVVGVGGAGVGSSAAAPAAAVPPCPRCGASDHRRSSSLKCPFHKK